MDDHGGGRALISNCSRVECSRHTDQRLRSFDVHRFTTVLPNMKSDLSLSRRTNPHRLAGTISIANLNI